MSPGWLDKLSREERDLKLDLTPTSTYFVDIGRAFLLLFHSKKTCGVAATVHNIFLEHFGDILDTITHPLANFGETICA